MDPSIYKYPWKELQYFKSYGAPKDIIFKEFESAIPSYLIAKKEEINIYELEHKWELAKKLANPYEMIYTQEEKFPHPNISLLRPLSRSYFKMIEILNISSFLKDILKDVQYLRSAHLAEGPGGFIQAFIDIVEGSRRKVKKIYAMTLKSDKPHIPGWKKASYFIKKYSSILDISYGKDDTGCMYVKENQDAFIQRVEQKVHLFTADGGFDFSIDYPQQEKQIFELLVCSFIVGFQVLNIGGTCVVKCFDTYSNSTQVLLSLCGSCFKEYIIYKPATSRPCNSERYFIGKGFKGSSTCIDQLYKIRNNLYTNLYPQADINPKEKEYFDHISNAYEYLQMKCIDTAKEYAVNPKLYVHVYKDHFEKSLKYCNDFKIPTKHTVAKELTWAECSFSSNAFQPEQKHHAE